MADQRKKNDQDKGNLEAESSMNEKSNYRLDKLTELMEKTGDVYSPLLMEELQHRLEFVIQDFNKELKALIKGSFKKWDNIDSKLRDLMAENLPIPQNQSLTEKSEDSNTPDFIKDVEFGPLRSK